MFVSWTEKSTGVYACLTCEYVLIQLLIKEEVVRIKGEGDRLVLGDKAR